MWDRVTRYNGRDANDRNVRTITGITGNNFCFRFKATEYNVTVPRDWLYFVFDPISNAYEKLQNI